MNSSYAIKHIFTFTNPDGSEAELREDGIFEILYNNGIYKRATGRITEIYWDANELVLDCSKKYCRNAEKIRFDWLLEVEELSR